MTTITELIEQARTEAREHVAELRRQPGPPLMPGTEEQIAWRTLIALASLGQDHPPADTTVDDLKAEIAKVDSLTLQAAFIEAQVGEQLSKAGTVVSQEAREAMCWRLAKLFAKQITEIRANAAIAVAKRGV
jgi:hypothetical protein